MTKVKICGITNLQDALAAMEFGADALGFNFYSKSPRFVDANLACEIVERLDGRATAVGVFVNESIDAVLQIAKESGIHAIQLHGDESAAYVEVIRAQTSSDVIKAFRIANGFSVATIEDYRLNTLLLDAYSPNLYGGSGETTDWETAKTIASKYPKVYLAGGLTPENVSDAIRIVRPYAVDVASGVESEKGKKDFKKLEAFIRNAKGA